MRGGEGEGGGRGMPGQPTSCVPTYFGTPTFIHTTYIPWDPFGHKANTPEKKKIGTGTGCVRAEPTTKAKGSVRPVSPCDATSDAQSKCCHTCRMSDLRSHVGCTVSHSALRSPCHSVFIAKTEIQEDKTESGPMLVGIVVSVDVLVLCVPSSGKKTAPRTTEPTTKAKGS